MKAITLFLLMITSVALQAQEVVVRSISRIRPEDNRTCIPVGVIPGTSQILVTGEGYNGLSLLETSTGKISTISNDKGAGYAPAVTSDGNKVIFRTNVFTGNRKYSSLYSYSLSSGVKQLLISNERGVRSPAVSGNAVLLKSDKMARVDNLGPVSLKSTEPETFVVIDNLSMVLYHGSEGKVLKPNGDGYYIWASLSPDGSKILYNYQGKSTFICDTDGNVLYEAGRMDAPRWLNDMIVIGMDDRDDGYRVTSSELVYYSLKQGRKIVLTDTRNRSEMYPLPFEGGKKIVFSTANGEIYVMKIKIR